MSIDKYMDIINMDRPISKKHRPMPLENRAAQFMPFAALTGYDDAVNETARITENKIELSEDEKAKLDLTLSELNSVIENHPRAVITYFVPDHTKAGGEYVTISANLRKIDYISRKIMLENKETISIDDVYSIDESDS